jgi:hypothetical protein
MRVLVAYEETYCFYQSVIARAIEDHHPHMQVCSVALEAIEEALASFDPHAVVCSRPSSEYPSGGTRGAWVELPTDPTQKWDICPDGDHESPLNPGLAKLLSILEEAHERLRGSWQSVVERLGRAPGNTPPTRLVHKPLRPSPIVRAHHSRIVRSEGYYW